jgi:hypothetical protein
MAECYDRCFDRCEGDDEAARICRGHCRDGSCGLLKLRCTLPEDPDDRRDRDPQYLFCCAENDTCDDDVGGDIDCEATTSTTSTTSTTGTTSTTSTTLRTTATTPSTP